MLVALLFIVSGCHAPQWRVFQSKVPEPLQKPAIQIEAERASADLVARTITAPPEAVPVAQKLSESLGTPEHPITQTKPAKARDEALDGLQSGIREAQQNLADLNERLAKYDGKKIEGTGVNVFGFAVSLPVIGLIALAIFCPSLFFWVLSTLFKVKGALVATVKAGQDFKDEHPELKKSFNDAMDKAQDATHKVLISKLKLDI